MGPRHFVTFVRLRRVEILLLTYLLFLAAAIIFPADFQLVLLENALWTKTELNQLTQDCGSPETEMAVLLFIYLFKHQRQRA